nr:hypothetical protein [Tanacetum cinerariifolium]
MEEILYKFINGGKREQEEMRAFIHEFRTTNELLFKERNNSLSELGFEVQGLLKVINNTPMSNLEVKGVTTRGGKTTTQDGQDNDTNLHTKEPLEINHDEAVKSNEVLTKHQPQNTEELVVQPTCELQTPPIPFPRRLRKEKEEAQQKKFLENLKQLHINLPFIKALAQMPKYAKFLKDFVILDMPEDSRVPIILGRLFLETARAMIDVFNKKITLRVGDDEVIFDMDQSIKRSPAEDDECYGVDELDDAINAEAQELLANDTTDLFLLKGLEKSIDQSDLESCECEAVDDSYSIRRMEAINTPYSVTRKMEESNKVKRILLHPDHTRRSKKDNIHLPLWDFRLPKNAVWITQRTGYFLKMHDGNFSWHGGRLYGNGKFKPIYYASKTLNNDQEHYTTTKKELLAAVFSFDKIRPYLILSKTIVYTDHLAFKYLFRKQNAKPGLIRWVLLLQGFNIEIKDKKGAKNLAVDHLSRLENPNLGRFAKEEIADKLFARFRVPKALISDRGINFCNSQLEKALQKYGVTHKLSTAYHPQTNVQTEVTNRAIKSILEMSVGYNLKNWSEKLDDALWAFRTAYKTPSGCTSFRLVYGKACHLPVEIKHKAYWALKQCNMNMTAVAKNRFMELNELMELRDGAYKNTQIYKERTKKWHDSRLRVDKNFKVGDKVLLFNSRFKMHSGKLKSGRYGPNVVKTMYPYGTIEIIDGNKISFKVNGQRLKKYHDEHTDAEDKEGVEFEKDTT